MKVLKLLVVSLFVFLPVFASAGLIDRVFPLLVRNSGNILRTRSGVPGVAHHLLINNAAFNNFQFVQYYGTRNGPGDNQDDLVIEVEQDEELVPGAQPSFANPNPNGVSQAHDPYCPHQAEWPARVARGELQQGGGTVFSDMLLQRYYSDRYDSVEGVQLSYAETNQIVFERVQDQWVQRYLNGEVPLVSPGIVGEQVLDLAEAGFFDSEYEEGLPEAEPSLSEEQLQELAAMVVARGWTAEALYKVVERNTNYMTGAVAIPNTQAQLEERILAEFHEVMVEAFRRNDFDMQECNAAVKALFDAVDALIKKE